MKTIIPFLVAFSLLISACASPMSNYEQPCNKKYNGVLIGSRCFDCGAKDKLCPDGFSDKEVCTSIPDPDC